MRPEPRQECAGQLKLWEAQHPCPVCAVDRDALGHHLVELSCPYSAEDLIQHLGSCGSEHDFLPWDEAYNPF